MGRTSSRLKRYRPRFRVRSPRRSRNPPDRGGAECSARCSGTVELRRPPKPSALTVLYGVRVTRTPVCFPIGHGCGLTGSAPDYMFSGPERPSAAYWREIHVETNAQHACCILCDIDCRPAVRGRPGAQAPEPGPEHAKLGYFVGKWKAEGETKAGPMGPGGKITSTDSLRVVRRALCVICRSEGTTPMGPTKNIGILGYSRRRRSTPIRGRQLGHDDVERPQGYRAGQHLDL